MQNQSNTDTITRSFGVEFEFAGGASRQVVAQKITNKGIDAMVEGYNHRTQRYWKIVTDASLCGRNAGELVSPILNGEEGIVEMKKVLDATSDVTTVNNSCGFHCHVDVRDFTLAEMKRVVKLFLQSEDALDAVLAPSRRGRSSRWAPTAMSVNARSSANTRNEENKRWFGLIDNCRNMDQLSRVFGTRYTKLNLFNIASRGAVEFRCHQGTLNQTKAAAWVKLCVALVESARQYSSVRPRAARKNGAARLPQVLTTLKVTGEIRKFLLQRSRELNITRRQERLSQSV